MSVYLQPLIENGVPIDIARDYVNRVNSKVMAAIPIADFVQRYYPKNYNKSFSSKTVPYQTVEEGMKMSVHSGLMKKIAVDSLSREFQNHTKNECKNAMTDVEGLKRLIAQKTLEHPYIDQPMVFYREHLGVEDPAQFHNSLVHGIVSAIELNWKDYKEKEWEYHNEGKFRKFFSERLSDVDIENLPDSATPTKARFQPIAQNINANPTFSRKSLMPVSQVIADSAPTRSLVPVQNEEKKFERKSRLGKKSGPNLVPVIRDSKPVEKKSSQSVSRPMKPLVSIADQHEVDTISPSVRRLVPLHSEDYLPNLVPIQRQPVQSRSKPKLVPIDASLRRIEKTDTTRDEEQAKLASTKGKARLIPIKGNSNRLLPLNHTSNIAQEKTSSHDLESVKELERYIRENAHALQTEKLIFFAPSNEAIKKLRIKSDRPLSGKFVERHLAHMYIDKTADMDFDTISGIRVKFNHNQTLQAPTVAAPAIEFVGEKQIGDFVIRVYKQDNIFSTTN